MGRRTKLAHAALAVLALGGLVGCRDLGPGGDDGGNKTSTVVYEVGGHGTADIQYAATATDQLTSASGVRLPWRVTVTTTDHSGTVYRVRATGGSGLDCAIEVNGVRVRSATPRTGTTADCSFIK